MLSTPVWRAKPTLRFFGIGLVLGAELIALLAAIVGAVVQSLIPFAVLAMPFGCVAILVLAREFGVLSFPIPENARLVPERVQDLGEVGALQFGFEMGTGMRTYSPSALPHLVVLGMMTILPFGVSLLAGLGFAFGRFLMPVLSNAHSSDGSWTKLWHTTQRSVMPLLAIAVVVSLASIVVSG